jgi:hypothetical protein
MAQTNIDALVQKSEILRYQAIASMGAPVRLRRRNSLTLALLPHADIEHHRRSPLREASIK